MITVHPATTDRFGDLAAILAPQSPETQACRLVLGQSPRRTPPPGALPHFEAAGFERVTAPSSKSGGARTG